MKLHAATIDGKEVILRQVDCKEEKINEFENCFVPIEKDDDSFHYGDLHRVIYPIETYNPATHKVVPKDAVVIEGDEIRDALGCAGECMRGGFRCRESHLKTIQNLLTQLTPPRLEEPKGFGAIVEAGCSKYSLEGRYKWVRLYKPGSVWLSENGNWAADFSDLINPVIISEGITPKEAGE